MIENPSQLSKYAAQQLHPQSLTAAVKLKREYLISVGPCVFLKSSFRTLASVLGSVGGGSNLVPKKVVPQVSLLAMEGLYSAERLL